MSGRLIAVVGASGAGKDTVMAEMAARRPGLHRVRRAITRTAEPGGEPFEPVSEADFARRHAAGDFVLSWQAHGLSYGIPAAELSGLATGRDALVNLSRGVLAEAQAAVPRFVVLHVTAPLEVRAKRLAARGRESEEDVLRRLSRRADLPAGLPVFEIDNSGRAQAAAEAALAALDTEKALP